MESNQSQEEPSIQQEDFASVQLKTAEEKLKTLFQNPEQQPTDQQLKLVVLEYVANKMVYWRVRPIFGVTKNPEDNSEIYAREGERWSSALFGIIGGSWVGAKRSLEVEAETEDDLAESPEHKQWANILKEAASRLPGSSSSIVM